MRLAAKILGALVLLYMLLVGGLAFAMRQPPDTFGQVMARMPKYSFLVLPFRPLWMYARGGSLQVGDVAPDFTLPTYDDTSRVTLSAHRGRPVVLVFGSYT